jgi:hypothetical protein
VSRLSRSRRSRSRARAWLLAPSAARSRSSNGDSTASTGASGKSCTPSYQRALSRTFWENCLRKKAEAIADIEWKSYKAVDSYHDVITLPLLGRTPVEAVTVRAVVEYLGKEQTVSDTRYFVRVGGEWRGVPLSADYRAYKAHSGPA